MTERLARASSRRPRHVGAIWLVAVLAAFPAIATFLGDVLTADVESTSQAESKPAEAVRGIGGLFDSDWERREEAEYLRRRSNEPGG